MAAQLLELGQDVLLLAADLLPLLVALVLARLIRAPIHAALIVVNLWLFMELFTTLVDPGYRFGSLLTARLLASALQVGLAWGAVHLWRHWRIGSESVASQ